MNESSEAERDWIIWEEKETTWGTRQTVGRMVPSSVTAVVFVVIVRQVAEL